MATYAIGDVQGCYHPLERLIRKIGFDPSRDRVWFAGDLVNRGPQSLQVLRYIKGLGASARVVLGNHDLFLLAVAEGLASLRPKDTVQDILTAPDRAELLAWLRQQPLCHREGPYVMVHAGLLPQWTVPDAVELARAAEYALTGSEWREFLSTLLQKPAHGWHTSLTGLTRAAAAAHVLTRIRTCTEDGLLSGYSGPPAQAPAGYHPWFHIPHRRNADHTIVFGHWASLGLHLTDNLLGLDSGCAWQRQLTAVRLEDRAVFQVDYSTAG